MEPDDQSVWGHGAAVYTTMTDCDGPVPRRRKRQRHGTDCALSTPASAMTADTAMPPDTTRWRIAPGFAEHAVLGLHPLPSLHRNAIQTVRSLRLLAFQGMDHGRHALGPTSQKKTPELSPREVGAGVQGRGQ